MHLISVLPARVRQLPFYTRLIAVFTCFFFYFLLMMMNFLSTKDYSVGPLIVLPVALAAWLLEPREVVLVVTSALLLLLLFNMVSIEGRAWSSAMLLGYLLGTFAVLIDLLVIGVLRYALDLANAAKGQAQQLSLLKDQFMLNVSHELRTPLTEVKGYLDLLLSTQEEPVDAELRALFLRSAAHGCEDLVLMVNNILDAVEIDYPSGKHTPEAVRLAVVVQQVLDNINLQDHPLQSDIPDTLVALIERQKLYQVIQNLLSNAMKYSPPESPIVLHAMLSDAQGRPCATPSAICISVEDKGDGIAAADLAQLFQRFGRLKRDMAGHIRGMGLGLYVSKRLIESMGGSIWVESTGRPGEGSRFRFTIPCIPLPTEQTTALQRQLVP